MRYPLEKYRYFFDGNRIIAVSSFAKKSVRGVAKCDESDNYDEEIGKKLAALRCAKKVAQKRVERASKKLTESSTAYEKAKDYASMMFEYYIDAIRENLAAAEELREFENSLKEQNSEEE